MSDVATSFIRALQMRDAEQEKILAEVFADVLLYQVDRQKLWDLYDQEKENPYFLRFLNKLFQDSFLQTHNHLALANMFFPVLVEEKREESDETVTVCCVDYDRKKKPCALVELTEEKPALFPLLNNLVGETDIFAAYFGEIRAGLRCEREHGSFVPGKKNYALMENLADFVEFPDAGFLCSTDFMSVYLQVESGLFILLQKYGFTLKDELYVDDILVKRRETPVLRRHHPSGKMFVSLFHVRLCEKLIFEFTSDARDATKYQDIISHQLSICERFGMLFGDDFREQTPQLLRDEEASGSGSSVVPQYREWAEQICTQREPFTLSDYLRHKDKLPELSKLALFQLYRRERNFIPPMLREKNWQNAPYFAIEYAKAVVELFPEDVRATLPLDSQDRDVFRDLAKIYEKVFGPA